MPSKDDLKFQIWLWYANRIGWLWMGVPHQDAFWNPLATVKNRQLETWKDQGGGNESVIKDRQVGSCSEPILAICLVWLPPHGKWPAQRALNAGVIKSLLLLSSVPLNPLLLVVTGTANCSWNKNGKFPSLMFSSSYSNFVGNGHRLKEYLKWFILIKTDTNVRTKISSHANSPLNSFNLDHFERNVHLAHHDKSELGKS